MPSKREREVQMAAESNDVVPMIAYGDGQAAMDWLAAVFGFHENERWVAADGVLQHGEMTTGRGRIIVSAPTSEYEGPLRHRSHCEQAAAWSRAPWVIDGVLVYVDDVISHFDHVKSAGATMLSGIERGPGDRSLYRVEDLEGHRWMFMQRQTDE
jgi:uncharacterized glyoxalase superfamily protein PhnB